METVSAPKGGRIVGFGGAGSRSAFEVAWAHDRPAHHRPPMCKAGDVVLYRSNDWFDEIPATVVEIVWDDRADQGFHSRPRFDADPWPNVRLKIAEHQIPADWDKRRRALARLGIMAHESRLVGSAGWLHPLWEHYPRPAFGAEGM